MHRVRPFTPRWSCSSPLLWNGPLLFPAAFSLAMPQQHPGPDPPGEFSGQPRPRIAAAEWLTARQPVLLGSDNWPVEVAPNPDPNNCLPAHQIALVVNGVPAENMKIDELAERRAYEFAFMMQPLKIAGGTGSTVVPSALLSRATPCARGTSAHTHRHRAGCRREAARARHCAPIHGRRADGGRVHRRRRPSRARRRLRGPRRRSARSR